MAESSTASRQIPIVCPGHTRPLADLQSFYVPSEQRSFWVSACHGASGCVAGCLSACGTGAAVVVLYSLTPRVWLVYGTSSFHRSLK